jgi:hypothetical protein
MHERNKWAFWTVVAAALALILVPSSVLLDAVARYERFLDGFEPPPPRAVRMKSVPHLGSEKGRFEPKLEFVDFRLRVQTAKKVCLVGDFNHWRPDTLPLAKTRDGIWEVTMPLPRGRYRYRFWVDGEERLDPDNDHSEQADGLAASVRDVK